MNNEVAQLEPAAIWTQFERLNEVPRPSKREARVIEFMKSFGEDLSLETLVDDAGNVLIRKPATQGMENRRPIVLQAHLDMVHQKNSETNFDFDSQGIESVIDGDWVKANGTTLGADNGIGAASIMAVLASDDIQHGPIEGLFTIDEETGMTGAFELKPNWLQGDILLNTDTEDHGELCIGCAGGVDTTAQFQFKPVTVPEGQGFEIKVTGLKGGHSGCEIHLGRGNANKIMNRLMYGCHDKFQMLIHKIEGGSLRNAIPRESFATVVVSVAKSIEFKTHVNNIANILKTELANTEPELSVEIAEVDLPADAVPGPLTEKIIAAIYAAPNGVIRMSDSVSGLVETSTSMAIVSVKNGKAEVQFLTRSSVETAKDDVSNAIESAFELAGATVNHSGGYPGWKPNPTSDILKVMKQAFADLFGAEPVVSAVHAGLECGIIGSHYPNMDMVSFGPTIKNPHSPDEMCHIESVLKYWDYLKAVLAAIPEK